MAHDHQSGEECAACGGGMENYLLQQEKMVAEFGHMVQGVGGTEDEPSFAYTIGLQQRGWPELLLIGVPYQYAGGMLNTLVSRYAKREVAPKAGDVVTEVGNWPCALSPVGPQAVQEYLCQAVHRAERMGLPEPTALHVVYPDREGNWPGMPEYDSDYMDPVQPSLAADGKWTVPTERAVESVDAE